MRYIEMYNIWEVETLKDIHDILDSFDTLPIIMASFEQSTIPENYLGFQSGYGRWQWRTIIKSESNNVVSCNALGQDGFDRRVAIDKNSKLYDEVLHNIAEIRSENI